MAQTFHRTCELIAWENSRHLATLPLVSPPNDVWETSAEIPYWWRVTSQICAVLLIGWVKFPTRHDQTEALPWSGYWRVISMEFLKPVVGSVAKCRLFSQASELSVRDASVAKLWMLISLVKFASNWFILGVAAVSMHTSNEWNKRIFSYKNQCASDRHTRQ